MENNWLKYNFYVINLKYINLVRCELFSEMTIVTAFYSNIFSYVKLDQQYTDNQSAVAKT